MPNVMIRGSAPKCPRCSDYKDVRQVMTPPGYQPGLQYFCCDYCEIGWIEAKGGRSKKLTGNLEMAKKAYIAEGRPDKLRSGRKR